VSEPTQVRLRRDGPILVDGPVEVLDHDGTVRRADGPTVALCRCGASARRPFCDGSHRDSGFDGTCPPEG